VEEDVLQQIRALEGDFEFEIYVSAVLPQLPGTWCAGGEPDGRQNPRIRTTMVDDFAVSGQGWARQTAMPTVF
jgi:alkyl hydroperoxide reductase subunit F